MALDAATEWICEGIGIVVFGICTVMKVPQIINIVRAGTTQGINIKSLLMEFFCFSTLLAYPIAKGYKVTGYMEFIVLTIQDLILVLMVLKDRNMLTVMTSAILVGYLSVITGMAMTILPPLVLYVMSSLVTPLAISSKLLQVYSIVSTKDAGTVSTLTWGLGTFTATARIFTGYVQSGDMFMVFLASQAAVLNSAICISSVIYRTKPKQE